MTEDNEIETAELETEELPEVEPEASGKPESAQETARAVWEELSAKADEADATAKVVGDELTEEAAKAKQAEKPNEISEAARKLASQRKVKRQTFVPAEAASSPQEPAKDPSAPKYEPPAGWEVKDKEWFLQQPPEVQKNALQWFKNAQGHTTKLWQDLNRQTAAAKEVNETLDRHWKDLNLPANFTKAQVVDQLLQYQKRINQDSVGAILEMMQHRGVTFNDLQARATGQTAVPPAVQQQVTHAARQNFLTAADIDRILEEREQRNSQSAALRQANDELATLARDVQNGRYTWPEMQDQQAIQRIQPLVTYYRESNPGGSWGQWYQAAIRQDRINRGVGTPSPASPRLTPENIQTVKQASSSLRSRGGNGAIPRSAEPRNGESARESAEAVYWEIFGKQH